MAFKALSGILFTLIGIFGINFLIGFHELGHFLFCKLFKIHTPTFSIGFGPKLISKKIGGTEFVLSAIPFGGFVEIAGMAEVAQGEQKEAHSKDKHSFASKPYYQKLLVMLGGILFNLGFAYAALILIFMLGVPQTGILYPRYAIPVVNTIEEGSAGKAALLQKGDTFIALDGQEVGNVAKIHEYINSHPDQTIQITVKRDDQQMVIPLTTASKQVDGKAIGTMGVLFEMPARPGDSFINALKNGCELTHAYIKATVNGFKQIFSKGDVTKMSGPVSIVSIVMKGAGEGFSIFLLILAIISINLAVLNLIPLPILDGGQILFYTIEAIIRRPLSPKIREYIHIASWIFALALILFLSAQDIYRLIQPYLAKIGSLLGIK
jgi:regulator of sigma E protease